MNHDNMETVIEQTFDPIDKYKSGLCEIRFDCIVNMYEMGVGVRKGGFFGLEEKSLPPQWFKLESKLTLDMIKSSDPYIIGMHIKQMLQRMDDHIKKYEKVKEK